MEKEERARFVEVEFFIDDDLGVVHANPTHVYQLFGNLISNYIRHNDSKAPRIDVVYRGR
ncbi:MAG: hypothetical protein SWK76_06805 [Actinomycetota bacterium]|nr:hypothetical protein [Actinomycetota bacterium]